MYVHVNLYSHVIRCVFMCVCGCACACTCTPIRV